MANEKKVVEEQKQEVVPAASEQPKQEMVPVTEEKKGFWKSLGTGAKIGLGLLGAGVVGVIALAVKSLFGGSDEVEEAVEETSEE